MYCFIAQNLGNKTKQRDHDPPGYFRSWKYPGYEVEIKLEQKHSSLHNLKLRYLWQLNVLERMPEIAY